LTIYNACVCERPSRLGSAAILLATLWIGCGATTSIGATPAPATASEVIAQSAPSGSPGDDAAHVVASVRSEALQLASGVIVLALGLSVLLLSAVIGRSSDVALVYFGVFATLYGLRLLALTYTAVTLYGVDLSTLRRVDDAITYVINVPILLFIERVFGSGWRSSITRVRQAWVVLAAIGLPVALLAQDPSRLMPANNILVIADVSGHGVPAALIASMVKVAISSQAEHADDPGRVLQGVNQILCGSLERQFVTAAYVFIDLEAQRLTGATAGHPPVLLWSAGEGRLVELGGSGLLLGHFPDAEYTPVEHRVADGDRVVLYTDGIIEATNRQGEFFDPERLQEFVARHPGASADAFCGALLDHLSSWCERGPDTGGFEDDITLVVASITTANP
jgi:hypothetical protein